ncbi:putative adenylate cyclase regulatory protein, partial [Fagus crenata]
GTKKVEAIYVDACDTSEVFTDEEFRKLPNLRFLRVDYADLLGDFKHLLLNLRWLQWRKCPGNSTPTNFHLKNLVILDLSNSCYLKDDWEGWSQIKMAKKLKVLNLSRSDNNTAIRPIKFPDEIGNLEKLEEIDASFSRDLHGEIPSSIGRLSSLRILRLDATNIYSLPASICGLSRLETLDLFGCNQLQSLPDELPSSLTSLSVTCELMETFPSRLSNLINLKKLVFCSFGNLVEIPRDIGKLSQLETLTLDCCDKLRTLPAEIGAISRLKELVLLSCGNLQCILALPSSLFTICVESCPSLERLPDLSNLKNLSPLTLGDLDKLREIPQLGELEYLDIVDCESLERLPNLSNLKKLQRIYIVKCKKLIEIQGFGKLELFTSLKIFGCESLKRLPDVSNLGMLKHLSLYGCKKLVEIEGLGGLKSLEILDVPFTSLERLDLSSLKNLKELKILHCKNLTEIQGLEELESLGFLNMAGCKLIEKLPDLSNLKKLKILIAYFCEKLTEIRGLEELKSLKLLDISGCKSIERLLDLSNTRIDTNSVRAKYWETLGWGEYDESEEWEGWESEEWKEWRSDAWEESEELEIPCSPSSSLKASKS